ncbi:hypothetical protein ACLOJK_030995 [Asimina triloba]
MGVQGLWELLAPVGRRVSVETLAGKRLAIDASIWMVQFMKAMRDERGEMVRNAHLVGFFRRICKLLFLRTKPVFVFDGGTPALKRRTVAARRRHRDNAQAKIRKTAEKLLLNHLRARKLEELANEMKIRKEKDTLKGKEVLENHDGSNDNNRERNEKNMKTYNRESLDELLAASLAAEENLNSTGNASTSVGFNPSEEEEEDGDENEEMLLPVMHGKFDPSILAALPPSLQLDLLVQASVYDIEIDEVQKSAAGRGVGGMQASRIASEPNREFIFSSSFTGDKR